MVAAAAPVSAQVDPLLFLKTAPPNVILVVDTANRMQRSAPTNPATVATSHATSHYYDPFIYTKNAANPIWQSSIGVTDANTAQFYRRRYNNLEYASNAVGDKFTASTIQTVGDRTPQPFACSRRRRACRSRAPRCTRLSTRTRRSRASAWSRCGRPIRRWRPRATPGRSPSQTRASRSPSRGRCSAAGQSHGRRSAPRTTGRPTPRACSWPGRTFRRRPTS